MWSRHSTDTGWWTACKKGHFVHLDYTVSIKTYEGLQYSTDEDNAKHLAHLLRLGILPEDWINRIVNNSRFLILPDMGLIPGPRRPRREGILLVFSRPSAAGRTGMASGCPLHGAYRHLARPVGEGLLQLPEIAKHMLWPGSGGGSGSKIQSRLHPKSAGKKPSGRFRTLTILSKIFWRCHHSELKKVHIRYPFFQKKTD